MAETRGLVQRLNIPAEPGSSVLPACVWIGPHLILSTLLVVTRRQSDAPHVGAYKTSIVDTLAIALYSRQEVILQHDDNNVEILSLEIVAS